jgi:hypothetical protein
MRTSAPYKSFGLSKSESFVQTSGKNSPQPLYKNTHDRIRLALETTVEVIGIILTILPLFVTKVRRKVG